MVVSDFSGFKLEYLEIKNPKLSMSISLDYEEVFVESLNRTVPKINKWMLQKQQRLEIEWLIENSMSADSDMFPEEMVFFQEPLIKYTLFNNGLEIINYPIVDIANEDLYLILEKE
ncbi:MAG: hypothetical protein Ta2D_08850 [Rickettsiales bacterium]|nr:MAG: hypothetical protein Ta2D_08850 [Rickettsiales bacterium]